MFAYAIHNWHCTSRKFFSRYGPGTQGSFSANFRTKKSTNTMSPLQYDKTCGIKIETMYCAVQFFKYYMSEHMAQNMHIQSNVSSYSDSQFTCMLAMLSTIVMSLLQYSNVGTVCDIFFKAVHFLTIDVKCIRMSA